MLGWLSTASARQFGDDIAAFIMGELSGSLDKHDAKFAAKAEKVLGKAAQRVQVFRRQEKLNVLKRASLANAFLWKLKDSGCPEEYANQLTEWLSHQL